VSLPEFGALYDGACIPSSTRKVAGGLDHPAPVDLLPTRRQAGQRVFGQRTEGIEQQRQVAVSKLSGTFFILDSHGRQLL
jgi:hypothetical protein